MQNIILIGYRASGKTSIGKRIAELTGRRFIDVDLKIIEHFNMSIAQIWQELGEPAFREIEAKIAKEIIHEKNAVISLGGGTPMNPDSAKAIKQVPNSLRIYLYCQPETLYRRIHADKTTTQNRPSLTAHNGNLEEIQNILSKRDPIYREVADIVFDTTNATSIDEAAKQLMKNYL